MTMPTLTILAGLPGSGKSHFLRTMEGMFPGTLVVHDFHANSIGHSREVNKSRHFSDVRDALLNGRNCVVADIEFCNAARRMAVEVHFAELATIQLVCFENDLSRCTRNVQRRGRNNETLEKCAKLSEKYSIPAGAYVIGVLGSSEGKQG